jgi:hypothetical protein
MNLKRLFNHIPKFKDVIEYTAREDYFTNSFTVFRIISDDPEVFYLGVTFRHLEISWKDRSLTKINSGYRTYLKVISKRRSREILALL